MLSNNPRPMRRMPCARFNCANSPDQRYRCQLCKNYFCHPHFFHDLHLQRGAKDYGLGDFKHLCLGCLMVLGRGAPWGVAARS